MRYPRLYPHTYLKLPHAYRFKLKGARLVMVTVVPAQTAPSRFLWRQSQCPPDGPTTSKTPHYRIHSQAGDSGPLSVRVGLALEHNSAPARPPRLLANGQSLLSHRWRTGTVEAGVAHNLE